MKLPSFLTLFIFCIANSIKAKDIWNNYSPLLGTVHSAATDKKGNMWFGTQHGGVAKFDGIRWTMYNTKNSALPSDYILYLKVDKLDNIWVGTFNQGLAKFDGNTWTSYSSFNSPLLANSIISMG